jgi:hypothetical protein
MGGLFYSGPLPLRGGRLYPGHSFSVGAYCTHDYTLSGVAFYIQDPSSSSTQDHSVSGVASSTQDHSLFKGGLLYSGPLSVWSLTFEADT